MDKTAIRILVERGLVTGKDLSEAAALQGHGGGSLGGSLIRLGVLSEDSLAEIIAEATGFKIITQPPKFDQIIAAQNLFRFSLSWLAEHEVLVWLDDNVGGCLASAGGEGRMVTEAADQWQIAENNRFIVTHRILRSTLSEIEDVQRRSVLQTRVTQQANLEELSEDAPAIEFVNSMLAEALARRASDIHIEPFKGDMIIRLRIDGGLHLWRRVPSARFAAIGSRIKLLCAMDIAERRMPQDGRHSVKIGGRDIDIRASCLPGVWGESIVLRFLGRTSDLPSLPALGIMSALQDKLLKLIRQPSGLLLVSGPTGSGKTTTVYKLMEELNDGSRKIITVEDPVEIDLPGVIQVNVKQDIGLDFAAGLRSILRQDPDVIFVGEIRDAETARMAVRAALTGHLVVSTVHTGSASATISRLLDLGIEGYLLAEALNGVLSQRLLRRTLSAADAIYSGRIGVYELLESTPAIRNAIRNSASKAELESLALASGFAPMRLDAQAKVAVGLTDQAEIDRVIGV